MKRRQQIFEYIKGYVDENNYSPTVREISLAVGLKSTSTVHSHLERLKRDGYIDFIPSSPRTLSILKRDWRDKSEQTSKTAR